jgi:mRNA interferase YafQ
VRLAEARGWDIDNLLLPPLAILLKGESLPARYKDHSLKGKWSGYREFHADNDWIVIYRVSGDFLIYDYPINSWHVILPENAHAMTSLEKTPPAVHRRLNR